MFETSAACVIAGTAVVATTRDTSVVSEIANCVIASDKPMTATIVVVIVILARRAKSFSAGRVRVEFND